MSNQELNAEAIGVGAPAVRQPAGGWNLGAATRWQRGQSGNPGGRQSALTKYIRGETKEGKELVDLLLAVTRGEVSWTTTRKGIRSGAKGDIKHVQTVEMVPTIGDRLEASRMLLDRGWGRPRELEEQEEPVFSNRRELMIAALEVIRDEAPDLLVVAGAETNPKAVEPNPHLRPEP
jgi:hypothetical protein